MKLKIVDDFLPRGEWLQVKEHLVDNPDIPFNFYEGKVYGKDANKNLQDAHMCHAFYHLNRFPKEPTASQYMGLLLPIIARCRVLAIHRIKANLELHGGSEPYESEYHVDWSNSEGDNIKSNMQAAIYYVNTNNGYTEFKDGEEVRKVESVANRMVFFDAELSHRGVSSTDSRYRCVINFNWFTWSNYYKFDQNFDTYY